MRRSAVLTLPSKVLLPLSLVALLASTVYGRLTGDLFGISALLGLVIVAGFTAIVAAGFRVNDVAPVVAEDAGPPAFYEVAQVPAPGGGAWPFLAAVAVTLGALGLVVSAVAFYFGLGVGLFTAVGWLARISNERTGREATLLPIGLPVVALFTVASVMFFMSRVLLAVPESASTFIALVVALAIMGGGILFAMKPSISSRTLVASLAVGGVLMVAGGIVAAAAGERKFEHGEAHGDGAALVALNTAFDTAELHLVAGSEGTIAFDNKDAGVPHNVAVYEGTDATGKKVFGGEIITGPATRKYSFPVPPPGSYFFQCDVHPATMKGTLKVTEAEAEAEGDGHESPGGESPAGDEHEGPGGGDNTGPTEREGGPGGEEH